MKLLPTETYYKPSFGILKSYKRTVEGTHLQGSYKHFDIDVYNNELLHTRLIYITSFGRWLMSKLIYSDFNKKFIRKNENLIRSEGL